MELYKDMTSNQNIKMNLGFTYAIIQKMAYNYTGFKESMGEEGQQPMGRGWTKENAEGEVLEENVQFPENVFKNFQPDSVKVFTYSKDETETLGYCNITGKESSEVKVLV